MLFANWKEDNYACCRVFTALTVGPENSIQLNLTLVLDWTCLALSYSHLVPAGGLPCRLLRHWEVKASGGTTSQQVLEMLVVWLILVAQSSHIKEEWGHLIWKTGTDSKINQSQYFHNNRPSRGSWTAWLNASSVAQLFAQALDTGLTLWSEINQRGSFNCEAWVMQQPRQCEPEGLTV